MKTRLLQIPEGRLSRLHGLPLHRWRLALAPEDLSRSERATPSAKMGTTRPIGSFLRIGRKTGRPKQPLGGTKQKSSPIRTLCTTGLRHDLIMSSPRDRLKQAMLESGFTPPTEAWLKHKLLFSRSTITSALNGNRAISRRAAQAFAKAFNVDPGWILYGSEVLNLQRDTEELAEILLYAASLPDREAKLLLLALEKRFGASSRQGLFSDLSAKNEAKEPPVRRKRS